MKTNPQLKNVADVISCLMLSDYEFDMGTIERSAEAEMSANNVEWSLIRRDNGTLVIDEAEYFFDEINVSNITPEKIYRMVELCMEVR